MNNNLHSNFPGIDVLKVAHYFLSKEGMPHKKLQKLCYYAQSWFLANYNEPLFPNRIEAWVHGPVSPDLYQTYRFWGWMDIPQKTDVQEFSDERVRSLLDEVYEVYGNYSGDELEIITHKEDPWKNARQDCLPQEYSRNPISMKEMRDYYGNRIGKRYD